MSSPRQPYSLYTSLVVYQLSMLTVGWNTAGRGGTFRRYHRASTDSAGNRVRVHLWTFRMTRLEELIPKGKSESVSQTLVRIYNIVLARARRV
jgi:hypothetical protein